MNTKPQKSHRVGTWLTAKQAIALLARQGCPLSESSFHTYLCRGKLKARRKTHPLNGHIQLYNKGDLLKSLSEKHLIEELTAAGYVTSQELYQEDCRMRQRFGITERGSFSDFRGALWYNKIPKKRIRGNLNLYHRESALTAFYKQYSDNKTSNRCSRHTLKSIEASHLHATQAILENPNYQPLDFLTACGVAQSRVQKWVAGFIIIPYYDTKRQRLLYPVWETIHRANHYTLKTIRTRLGNKYAQHVEASRDFLQWETPNGTRRLYYCPECSEKQRHRNF